MAYLGTVCLYAGLFLDLSTEFVFFIIYILVFLLLIQNIFAKTNRLVDVGLTVLAFVYIAISLYHIVLFARSPHASLIWLIFIVAWMTDTSAYFAGMLFGKTKLIPAVSPKKTVEGAVGGVIGATILGMIYIYWVMGGISSLWLIPILMVGSALSQLGDLVASKIKRGLQIKDFGNIMPGHGGVLDRFDSILIVAPYVYYAIRFATKAPF
jgi:phosphatidate cytidylyltransferase